MELLISAVEVPRITEHPLDVMVPRHEPTTLNCKAEGSPMPEIQWYKDGDLLTLETGSHRMALPAGGLFFLRVSKLYLVLERAQSWETVFTMPNHLSMYTEGGVHSPPKDKHFHGDF